MFEFIDPITLKWFIIGIASVITPIIAIIIIMRIRKLPKAIFLKNINGVYFKVGKKRFSITKDKITYKGRTFIVDKKRFAYYGSSPVIFFDIDKTTPIPFGKIKESISAEFIDDILTKGIVSQLAKKLSPKQLLMESTLLMILALSLGLALGYILGQYYPIAPPTAPSTTPTLTNKTITVW